MALKPQQQKQIRKKKALRKKDASKKESFNLTVPFSQAHIGQTILNKQNTEVVAERKLKGRVFEVFQQDLDFPSAVPRKLSFLVGSLRGKDLKSHFNGLVLSTDKQKSLVKKWHTLVESYTDVTTKEGIKLRIFLVCTSKRVSAKKHCYLKNSLRKEVRKSQISATEKLMNELPLNELVRMVMNDKIDKSLEEEGSAVAPIQNCHVRKIKVIKRPREILSE